MAKDYKYGGGYRYGYAPAPSTPSMEITINQNGSNSGSYGGSSRLPPIRPPPTAPPPPPPEYCVPDHPAFNPMWIDRFPRRENRGMFRLALVELLLAVVILGGGIWCYRDTSDYCPYYSAIWTSAIYVINALVGSAAAKIGTINLYMAHLTLSLVSIMMCFISGGLSARNWALVGTYHHPRIERDEAFCLLGQHDTGRISYIFSHMNKYDFANCLWQLKVGVAVNSVQFVIAAIEILLNALSAILCMKKNVHVVLLSSKRKRENFIIFFDFNTEMSLYCDCTQLREPPLFDGHNTFKSQRFLGISTSLIPHFQFATVSDK
ncbi:unnamed protein product [Caenorhabditis auriculariae]|uniref:Uncharacterized protein n=1 Tax=Caenorhabditis auriculariae TaxID=2777116 RepID=A0A8S1GZ07_9PELO|nr:unnamed protein product [Caenorhabditis auriculariae]